MPVRERAFIYASVLCQLESERRRMAKAERAARKK